MQKGDAVRVKVVSTGSPAARAGIQEGDELVAVDEEPVTMDILRLRPFFDGPTGKKIDLTLRRDGRSCDISITLADWEIWHKTSTQPINQK